MAGAYWLAGEKRGAAGGDGYVIAGYVIVSDHWLSKVAPSWNE
jgi:hypothetical protein